MKRILTIAALALAGATTGAYANPVVCQAQTFNINQVSNCGFETDSFSGWTLGGASYALSQTNLYGVDGAVPNSGSYAAYFGTEGATPGTSGGTAGALELSQGFTFEAGRTYQISFYLGQDTPILPGYTNFFEASFDGAALLTETAAPVSGYTEYTYTVTSTIAGTNTLAFYLQNDAGYWNLDDISVLEVPEPASLALFGIGAAALVAARRRKPA